MLIALPPGVLRSRNSVILGSREERCGFGEIVDAFAALTDQEEGKRRCLLDMIIGGQVGGQVERQG